MTCNPNEQAHPVANGHGWIPGLTKREEFAKAALTGLMANADYMKAIKDPRNAPRALAASAVEVADNLIAELNREGARTVVFGISHHKHGEIYMEGKGAGWAAAVMCNALDDEIHGGEPVKPIDPKDMAK